MLSKIASGMVLAAGLGTRMRPLTLTTPKPLITVLGRTMADRAIDRLVDAGVSKVVLNASYLGQQIIDHFANRTDIGIDVSWEDTPLETGGGVQRALPYLEGEAFFVLNGDAILCDGKVATLKRLSDHWHSEESDILLLLIRREEAVGYDGAGDFFLNDDGMPEFRESHPEAPYVFSGTQILSRHLFEVSRKGAWSLREIYEKAIKEKRARAIVHDGLWLHVGTPEGLTVAEEILKNKGE